MSYPVTNGKTVVFGQCRNGKIIALDDATGVKRWEVQTLHDVMSAACFEGDVAYIAGTDKCVYAIDWASGMVRWKSRLGDAIWSRPCVVNDRVFVA